MTKSGKRKEFDVNLALELLKKMPEDEDSLAFKRKNNIRQLIFEGYEEIRQLLNKGYTRKQISEYLRQKLGVDFSDTTFYNYLAEATKAFGNTQKTPAENSGEPPFPNGNGFIHDSGEEVAPPELQSGHVAQKCQNQIPDKGAAYPPAEARGLATQFDEIATAAEDTPKNITDAKRPATSIFSKIFGNFFASSIRKNSDYVE